MTLDFKQRESLRQLSGKIYHLAGTVNDNENIAFKADWEGMSLEHVQKLLEIASECGCRG